jgi:D-alanyl-lipoteichoic acid acyltransferase DltB (MBOAT superfamily)
MKVKNTFIIFLVSGLWHGANWTFVFWGALNALYFLPLLLLGQNRNNLNEIAENRMLPSIREAVGILVTFCLTSFAWIFFRAESLDHAFGYIDGLFSNSLFSSPGILPKKVLMLVFLFLVVEWFGRSSAYAIENVRKIKMSWVRWSVYATLILFLFFFGEFAENIEFIYFQF